MIYINQILGSCIRKSVFLCSFFVSIHFIWAQENSLQVTLDATSQVAVDGLYYEGEKNVNYRFSPRITPHGDCIDVVNGYVFVTWYKGGVEKRNLMLSRKNLNVPNSNWVTIEFPHQHVGIGGTNPNMGDSHNTAAIGVSTIDGTIHLLYDMHAYRESNLPNDFFNYSVSYTNKAFVPDAEFTLAIFKPKQNYLKQGGNYDRVTYPMIHRATDGSLIARFRIGGSGNGDIFMAHYNGTSWTNNWMFQEGTLASPNTNSLYGGERFLNGRFYAGFSIRYATNNNETTSNGFMLNSGLYFAYTNTIPTNQSSQWFDAFGAGISLPIRNNVNASLDPVKVGEPSDDYGTALLPRTSNDPAWTVTENEAVHFVTRVDGKNVHYFKTSNTNTFSSAQGALIPNPEVRGELYSYKNHVFMVELLGGKVNIKTTLDDRSDWKVVLSETSASTYAHFDAFVDGNKLYVYLMEQVSGDARPLYLKIFTLSELDQSADDTAKIILEAEDYTTASSDIIVGTNSTASAGEYIDSFSASQWLEYVFEPTIVGTYDFVLVAANRNRDDSIMDIEINGQLYSNVLITRTYDWAVYGETRLSNVVLNQGSNVVKLTQKRSLSSEPDKLEFHLISSLSKDFVEQKSAVVFPNPSKGIFNIHTTIQQATFRLVDMNGITIASGFLLNNTLDFLQVKKGIYFLEISNIEGRLTKKIMIN